MINNHCLEATIGEKREKIAARELGRRFFFDVTDYT